MGLYAVVTPRVFAFNLVFSVECVENIVFAATVASRKATIVYNSGVIALSTIATRFVFACNQVCFLECFGNACLMAIVALPHLPCSQVLFPIVHGYGLPTPCVLFVLTPLGMNIVDILVHVGFTKTKFSPRHTYGLMIIMLLGWDDRPHLPNSGSFSSFMSTNISRIELSSSSTSSTGTPPRKCSSVRETGGCDDEVHRTRQPHYVWVNS